MLRVLIAIFSLLYINTGFAADKDINQILPPFEQYAEKAMQDWQVPGMAMAIVKDNKIIYLKGFGVKKTGAPDKVDANTVFQIGSISKSFTALLAAILVDQNKIHWKDRVIDYYPEFIMHDPAVTREFTVQDLFAQNSGLPAHVGDTKAVLGYAPQQILDSLRYIKPVSSFRSQFDYQNVFFVVADNMMKNMTHKSWAELLNDEIFQPLDMKNSSITSQAFDAASNRAALHQRQQGKVTALPVNYEGKEFVYIMAPAGGINSTISDMANYAMMLLNNGAYQGKQIISPENLHYLWQPKTIMKERNGRWSFYGLGWVYTQYNPSPIMWHNGATLGHKSMIALLPDQKLGIVILSNLASTELPEALAMQFIDMATGNADQDWSAKLLKAQHQVSQTEKPVAVKHADPLPLESYTGTYHNPVYGNVEIKADKNQLYMLIGPHQTRMDITPVFRDIFRLQWTGAGEDLNDSNDKVHFVVDIDGKAKLIQIEFFKDEAGGFFKRVS